MSKSVEEIKKSCDGKVKTEITKFYPIGRTSNKSFSGTFEGNTKTISNLTIDMTNETNSSDKDYVGLFGYSKGTIKGFTLDNVDIKGQNNVGGLVGYQNDLDIEDISMNNVNVSGDSYIGGVTGALHLSDSKGLTLNNLNINGNTNVGGVTGLLDYSNVYTVIVKGNVSGDSYVGGVAGAYKSSINISSVIINANISGNSSVSATYYSLNNSNYSDGIIEGGTINGNLKSESIYYIEDAQIDNSDNGTKLSRSSLHSLSAYSNVLDTYIGCDSNSHGYYFDYDNKNNIVVKNLKKSPIEFKLKGTGTEENPYLISSYNDWKQAVTKANQENAHFKLTKDIDFTGKNFYMFGNSRNPFKGVLDGDNHKLSGIKLVGGKYQGIVGYMNGTKSIIKNLIIENINLSNISSYSGILVGYLKKGLISNITVKNSKIDAPYNEKFITNYIGGLVGYSESGVISNVNLKKVNVHGKDYIGGLIGYSNKGTNTEINAYDLSVDGYSYIGGLLGYNSGKSKAISLNKINIVGSYDVGGGIGYNDSGTILEGILNGSVKGQSISGGIVGNNSGIAKNMLLNLNLEGLYKIYEYSQYNVYDSIFESGTIKNIETYSRHGTNLYYVEGVIADKSLYGTKIDKQYLHNLSYYSQLKDSSGNPIIETEATGDVNGTGYVFGYDSNNNIIIERKN